MRVQKSKDVWHLCVDVAAMYILLSNYYSNIIRLEVIISRS